MNPQAIVHHHPSQQVILPPIYPNYTSEAEKERMERLQSSFKYVNNRLARSGNYSSPFINYPLYPQDMNRFLINYPSSLYYYRPIRYFFQRPVQLDYDNCFPHQKKVLKELMERDEKIKKQLDKKTVKYGIPKRMEDILRGGEIVHYPTATIISAADLKKKQEEFNKLQEKIDQLGPEGQRKIKIRNGELRDIIRKIIYFNDFLLDLRTYSKSAIALRNNKFVHIQATKANINEIKTFMLRILRNIEQFSCQFLGEKINLQTTEQKKKEESLFVIKSFVHQLFNDISSAFCNKDDVPDGIKALFRAYISEKSVLPPFFLTTFEFNRLEFDIRMRLNQMTLDRQALMVGFILFYRVLLIDIFKNYLTYFPKLRDLGNPIPEILDQKIKKNASLAKGQKQNNIASPIPSKNNNNNLPNQRNQGNNSMNNQPNSNNQRNVNIIQGLQSKDADAQILYYKKKKEQIRQNLEYNFNFIIQLLHHIFKTSFENHPDPDFWKNKDEKYMFFNYFKNKNLYGKMVYSMEEDEKRQLLDDSTNTDDIEIMHGIFKPTVECEAFIAENTRWIHMYQLNTIQFCEEFAKMIMEPRK